MDFCVLHPSHFQNSIIEPIRFTAVAGASHNRHGTHRPILYGFSTLLSRYLGLSFPEPARYWPKSSHFASLRNLERLLIFLLSLHGLRTTPVTEHPTGRAGVGERCASWALLFFVVLHFSSRCRRWHAKIIENQESVMAAPLQNLHKCGKRE